MTAIPISWSIHVSLKDNLLPVLLTDLADSGCRRLSLDGKAMEQLLEQPELEKHFRNHLAQCGLELFDAHAPHRAGQNIGCDAARHAGVVALQKQVIKLAGDLGVRTLTMHIAVPEMHRTSEQEALNRIRNGVEQALEALLPVAEQCGVVIALENHCGKSGSCRQLCGYMEKFHNSNLGICYDAGHANIKPQTIDDDDDDLDLVLPYLVTVNVHDNDGKADCHLLPGKGSINWQKLLSRLDSAPRLLSRQCKVSPAEFLDDPASGMRYFYACGLA